METAVVQEKADYDKIVKSPAFQFIPIDLSHSELVLPQDKQCTRQRDLPHVREQVLLVLSNV